MAAFQRAEDIAERIRGLRKALGQSQTDFGSHAGVAYQAVGEWESGKSRPTRGTLRTLAKNLGIPINAFAEGGPMPSDFVDGSHGGIAASSVREEEAPAYGGRPLDHLRARAQRVALVPLPEVEDMIDQAETAMVRTVERAVEEARREARRVLRKELEEQEAGRRHRPRGRVSGDE